MYNRYCPHDGYRPLEPEEPAAGGRSASGPFSFLQGLLGGAKNAGGPGIWDKLGLSRLDRGDILLLLILLYLFRESDDEEWLIILALVLLMGLS